MMARVRAAVTEMTRHFEGRDVIAVAHAGTIRAALAVALDLSPHAALSFVIDPLSLTRLDAIGDGWRVGGVNMSGHP
jgi:alpha-ribazole phosphatase